MKKNDILQDKLNQSLSRFKDKIAIEYGDRALTYAQLDRKTNYIANWLIGQGLAKETFIGVLIHDRMALLASMIGILKAGCVFIPLDPALPPGRLGVMMDSTDMKYLLIDKAHADVWSLHHAVKNRERKLIPVEELFSHTDRQGLQGKDSWFDNPVHVRCSPEDKIYIYFTSGSTGCPRAILGRNKSLLHFIDWEIETICKNEAFRVSQFTTPGFDAFLRDVLVPLCSGGVVCIPGDIHKRPDPDELVAWIDRSRIQLIHCVPRVFRMLSSNNLGRHNLKTLKYILLSGEKVNPQDLVPWFNLFNGRIQLVNLWGTSETTLAKTAYFIQESDIHRERIPVGKPIKGTRVVVLNENLDICNPGIVGDLYIRTPYRTFGYYNEPGLNKERFIRNPFNDDPNDLLHKTGDLGRVLPDGNLDVLGRNDRQVKIMGIRVELEEIESSLVKYPSIKEAVVIKKELANNNELLCAFVTQDETGEMKTDNSSEDLRAYLREQLPDYMVPARIIQINKIPVTPGGKINYQRLHGWSIHQAMDYIPPGDEIEKKLVELWSQLLGVEKIGVTTRFFELGGNSLEVLALAAKIHKEFNIRTTLFEIFNNPTIREQAEMIKKSEGEQYLLIVNAELKEYYELSPAQKRIYFMQQWNPNIVSYNMFRVVQLEGKLDKQRLEKTFMALIRRHESLRTSFKMVRERPVQKIHRPGEVKFAIEYFDSKAIIKNFNRPFDLSCAPLLRVGLIQTAEEKYLLMVDMHHTVSDGISSGIFVREAAALYRGVNLPGLRLQYKDFSRWQTRQKQGGILKRQEEYWLKVFAGEIPVLDIPMDFKRPSLQSFEGSHLRFEIDGHEAEVLKKVTAAENATMFMVLLAIFNILLAKLSGQQDIIVGTVISGRRHEDLRGITGIFVNTLALRNFSAKDMTFKEFLVSVRDNTLKAFDNQDYPLEDLVDKVETDRAADRNPLFSVTFDEITEETGQPETNRAGDKIGQRKTAPPPPMLKLAPYGYDREISNFDLMLRRIVLKDRLIFKMVYCTKLFKRETIKRFIKSFKEIVSVVVENNEIKVGEISISHDLLTVQSNHLEDYQRDFVF